MKKKAQFLVAGLAAITAGLFVHGSAFAAQSVTVLESEDDVRLAEALVNHTNISNIGYMENGPQPYEDNEVLVISDGNRPDTLEFDCSDGNPLAGIKDWSLLSRNTSTTSFFSDINYVRLCDATDVDWDELAKFESLADIMISEIDNPDELSNHDLMELRDEVATKPVVDISGISKLTNLEIVRIIGVPLGSLQTLPQLPHLNEAVLMADGITDISGIGDMGNPFDHNIGTLYTYNNIVDAQPLMDYCLEHNICSSDDWASFAYSGHLTKIWGSKANIETSSEVVEIPAHIQGLIKGIMSNAYVNYADEGFITTVGLDYTLGESTAKLDLSASKHILRIANPFGNEDWFVVEFTYKGQENPDTADSFNLGWVIGIAAAILASASFVVRSRR